LILEGALYYFLLSAGQGGMSPAIDTKTSEKRATLLLFTPPAVEVMRPKNKDQAS
jgi:hypothetical protein